MSWLYRKTDGEPKLFPSHEAAEEALGTGEWEDTPAKCDTVAGDDYSELTVEELVAQFDIKQLRAMCKTKGIKITRQNTIEELAQAIVDNVSNLSE